MIHIFWSEATFVSRLWFWKIFLFCRDLKHIKMYMF